MDLNFREYYEQYGSHYGDDQYYREPNQWRWPGKWTGALGGAYVGGALGGLPGAVIGGLGGYALGKYLGPKRRAHADPRAFTYWRDEYGRVQRTPISPYGHGEDDDLQHLSDEEIEQRNADPTHPYVYARGRDGKVQWRRKHAGYGGGGYGNRGYGGYGGWGQSNRYR